jgi:hypothetical protein
MPAHDGIHDFLLSEKGRVFFFVNKKEAKKTLIPPLRHGRCLNKEIKVFLLLFVHKKKFLLSLP